MGRIRKLSGSSPSHEVSKGVREEISIHALPATIPHIPHQGVSFAQLAAHLLEVPHFRDPKINRTISEVLVVAILKGVEDGITGGTPQ